MQAEPEGAEKLAGILGEAVESDVEWGKRETVGGVYEANECSVIFAEFCPADVAGDCRAGNAKSG